MIAKTYAITEKLLDNGSIFVQELYELLIQEQANLKNRSTPEIVSRLAEDKKATAVKLEQFSKQLAQVLATENLTLDQNGIKQYFDKAQAVGIQVSDAVNQWHQISTIAAQCQTLNDQIGAGIHLLIRHNHRSLQIIQGKSQTSSTYGPDGATRSERFSQSLVSV